MRKAENFTPRFIYITVGASLMIRDKSRALLNGPLFSDRSLDKLVSRRAFKIREYPRLRNAEPRAEIQSPGVLSRVCSFQRSEKDESSERERCKFVDALGDEGGSRRSMAESRARDQFRSLVNPTVGTLAR